MNAATADGSKRVSRVLVAGIVLYFVLRGYEAVANEPLAGIAANAVFGAIAVGLGAVLYLQAEGESSAVLGASICFVAGGVLQFVVLLVGLATLDQLSSLAVFAGIGFYAYAVWDVT